MWAYAAVAASQLLGGYQQAAVINQTGQVNQSIADMNAGFAYLDAFNAQKSGYTQAAEYADTANAAIAGTRDAFAGSNTTIGYGTAGAAEADTKLTAQMNVLQIQRQAQEKAAGFDMQAIQTTLGGAMGKAQSAMDASAAESRGLSSAIGTGLSAYSQWNTTNGVKSPSTSQPTYRGAAVTGGQTMSQGTQSGGSDPAWFFGSSPSPYSQPSFGMDQ